MAEGRLPHLSALRARGGYMPLRSTRPPATFPAWTTCTTGVNPGRHGIFDFTEMTPGRYALRFVNSTHRQTPALWNIISAAGGRVGVLGVPGTFPPEPVNGFMVSGFDSPVAARLDPSMAYPESIYPEVRDWRFADLQETAIRPGWHERALPALLRKIDDQERIACRLLAREPWDFFMAVFSETDTVSHHFWLFHDPDSPRHRPGPATAIRDVYERLDKTVGVLIEAAGGGATVAVVSDHGFGGTGSGVVHLNNWLAEQGYLTFGGGGTPWLKRAAMFLAPGAMRGALFRRFRNWAARAESASRFGGIDWARTTAWSEELNYFPSIRVNLAGREPKGTVLPQDYAIFVRDLCAQLESWPVIRHAWPRAALYHGPCVERAPDIVLEFALENGYSHSCLRSRGGPPFRRISPGEYLGGKERGMNGNHRGEGVLFASRAIEAETALIEDIAPSVLAALGVPGPPMEGKRLWGADAGQAAEAPRTAAERPFTPEEEALIETRLRGLGYFE